jgi:hypothetical protein
MRKTRIIEHISLDGVIQAPGVSERGRRLPPWRMGAAACRPGRERSRVSRNPRDIFRTERAESPF